MYWRLFRSVVEEWSVRTLGQSLPAGPDPRSFSGERPSPTFYGISPHILPRPPDWSADTHVDGFWFLGPPPGWSPPDELVQFLADGPQPVYVANTRIDVRPSSRLVAMVLEAVGRTGHRVLLATAGDEDVPGLPAAAMAVGSVPFSWLFPQVAVVVHHGGAGTVAAALRAGVPSLGVPGFFDQPFWSRWLVELGVGVGPVPTKALTTERLAGAIEQLTSDAGLRQRARALGELVRQDDGVRSTVARIEHRYTV